MFPPEVKPKHEDFEIIGFPCNQFGGQDPGSNDEIQSFCQLNYGVTFPVLGKTDVNGEKAEPVWEWMKSEKPGIMGLKRVKWNFEKFLIGRDGKVKQRWGTFTHISGVNSSHANIFRSASTSSPDKIKADIEAALNEKAPAS